MMKGIHAHPELERKLGVPEDHVIVDREVFNEEWAKQLHARTLVESREFTGGATRDGEADKLDYEGFLSPLVIKGYGDYLHRHRLQSDGQVRDSDNWQSGMPLSVYLKSLWRHLVDIWSLHRGYRVYRERVDGREKTYVVCKVSECVPSSWVRVTREDALCGIIFNSSGYLHEWMKGTTE